MGYQPPIRPRPGSEFAPTTKRDFNHDYYHARMAELDREKQLRNARAAGGQLVQRSNDDEIVRLRALLQENNIKY